MNKPPPRFITIRTPPKATEPPTTVTATFDVYEVALELVRLVHTALETSAARFHLKDRLDRATTQVALQIARAAQSLASERWKAYREVLATVTDIATLLDVLDKQQATTKPGSLSAARYVAQRLLAELAPLAAVRTAPV
ncbi:MAG TPA: hypothetical protein VGG28_09030 [Kofleriaceae bacterium]